MTEAEQIAEAREAYKEYLKTQAAFGTEIKQEETSLPKLQKLAEKPMNTALNMLDYERAVSGGPLAAKLLELTSGKKVVTPQEESASSDLGQNFPPTSEMIKRAGYLENDPYYARTLLGMAGDVVTSPSTYLSIGGAAIPKIGKAAKVVMSPASEGIHALLSSAGKKTQKSAFARLDAAAMKAGKDGLMPSDILTGQKVWSWSGGGLDEKFRNVIKNLDNQVKNIEAKGVAPGKEGSASRALEEGYAVVRELEAIPNPEAQKHAMALRSHLNETKKMIEGVPEIRVPGGLETQQIPLLDEFGQPMSRTIQLPDQVTPAVPPIPLTPELAAKTKRYSREALAGGAYSPTSPNKYPEAFTKAESHGFQKEAEYLTAEPEKYSKLNEVLGILLSAKNESLKESIKDTLVSSIRPTSMDVALGLGGGFAGSGDDFFNPKTAFQAIAAKKIVQGLARPGVKSAIGMGLRQAGETVPGKLATKFVGRSPWEFNLQNQQPEE